MPDFNSNNSQIHLKWVLSVVVSMLYKLKNNAAKLKNQNGGLIHDGCDLFFIFHIISQNLDFRFGNTVL
jgi:hypothetical protein